ncbi:helix-turn-helix domain-containing protein [Caulobacter sp. NIBR1757]|uniref:helix-turn-helix domain-containing protein n=1 Tax=Caulobacter sp. NIBR1757 TaxID=3016000 RepID=UPI0022F10328|nr:helix-turn-helix domain-containing protein [Caulobacter sp. NIBR1757]WGM38311.1 Nitrogen fixation regulation protein FixK [Caulobacter sp. NIBR1757]
MTTVSLKPAFAAPPVPADQLGSIGVRMAFAAGEEIYAQDEEADMIYRVVSGAIRTSRLLSDGRRQIGDFYYNGDFVGLEAGPVHRYSAEALGPCEILVIRKSALKLYGEEGIRIERMIWAETARELQRTQEHLMLLGRKSACEKVASFLLGMAGRFRGEVAELPMGRQDMADYLGLTIETVSRMVTQLQVDGLVRFVDNRRFEVRNQPGLAQLVEA